MTRRGLFRFLGGAAATPLVIASGSSADLIFDSTPRVPLARFNFDGERFFQLMEDRFGPGFMVRVEDVMKRANAVSFGFRNFGAADD